MLVLGSAPSHAEWSSSAGNWYRYPLPGAEVKSLVADPNVSDTFYAGTAQGGIYRSTDGGRTWSSSPGGSPYPGYSVTSLAVDPLQGATLWAGLTGVVRGGILARSDDRGQTFFEVRRWDERAAARVVAVSVQGGRRLLAVGGDYGVELSDDGGSTWRTSSPALDPGSGISFLAFHPRRETLLYCGSFRHPFLSTDLGRTWKRIATGMIEDTEVFALDFSSKNPDDFWAATCGWVYRTTDGAKTWTRYKTGLSDRRTHVVRTDPLDPARILAGTTGGLFESRDSGSNFHRIGPEMVVTAITFDPHHPNVLLIGTEAEGILRSEDGGLTIRESNRGLAEARVSSVSTTASGRVIVSRAADGASGGLWTIDPRTGDTEKLLPSPPSTVLALTSVGEALLAGTPDGIFHCEAPGRPWTIVLGRATRGFVADGSLRVLAATEAGVYESRDQGRSWSRMGSLTGRVDGVTRARFTGLGITTMAAESGGRTLWWDGREWVFQAVKAEGGRRLTGGFGRPRASLQWKPEPIGLEVDSVRSLLFFRPADESADGIALRFPEAGLSVAGWSGDPRGSEGLYLATIGRGLFRFVPTPVVVAPEAPLVPPIVAAQRSGTSR
jgi:photosystem II stability/assembly factor-like uncharacterized protein